MIRIYCSKADATLLETETLTAGMVNIPNVLFTFSSDWDGLGKTAIVRAGTVIREVVLENNQITIPAECLAKAGVNLIVGVWGGNFVTELPTVWCACGEIQDSTNPSAATNHEDPTASNVAQMLAAAERAEAAVDQIENANWDDVAEKVGNQKVNKPTTSPNGTSGQILKTNGDGSTTWIDAPDVFGDQIEEVVSGWLDDHPEATTTVDFRIVNKVLASVEAMKEDRSLSEGDHVLTEGYYVGDTGGSAHYIVREIESGETADEAFLIALDNGLGAELVLGDKHINVKWCGAKGDNTTDDSAAFNKAIAKMNATKLPIYLPYGNYVIEEDLDDVYVGFCIYADGIDTTDENHKTVIQDKRTGTNKYLFNQDGTTYTKYNGGYIQNISFKAVIGNNLNCIKIVTRGWDGKIRDCGFYGYDQALYLDGDEYKIDRCSFIRCGSKSVSSASDKPVYGVCVYGANEKRFDHCHFEHTRFFLEVSGVGDNCYHNTFTNCKFEQGNGSYSNFLSTYPLIYMDITSFAKYHTKFLQCDFHCMDMNYYVTQLNAESFSPSDGTPFLFAQSSQNVGTAEFSGCAFVAGPGTGTTAYSHYAQSRFVKGGRIILENCNFIRPSFYAYSIYSDGNADGSILIVRDCEFIVDTTYASEYNNSLKLDYPAVIGVTNSNFGLKYIKSNTLEYRVAPTEHVLLSNMNADYTVSMTNNTTTRTSGQTDCPIRPIYGKNTSIYGGFTGEYVTLVIVMFGETLNAKFNLKYTIPGVGNHIFDIDFTLRNGKQEFFVQIDDSRTYLDPNASDVTITGYLKGKSKLYIQIPILNATVGWAFLELNSYFDKSKIDWYVDRTIYNQLSSSDYDYSQVLYTNVE